MGGRLVVVCSIVGTLAASVVHAQDRGARRFELSGGVIWMGLSSFGSQPATETPVSGDRLELFSTSTKLAPAADVAGGMAVRITSALDVEGAVAYGRPSLRTLVGGDVEGAADVTAEETVQRLSVSGGMRWRIARWRVGRRAAPFVSAGAGYLRELHEGATLAVNGQTLYGGFGVDVPLASRSQLTAVGVRVEARMTLRRNGVGFDAAFHAVPSLAASIFFRF
jgi:hypothetical protein